MTESTMAEPDSLESVSLSWSSSSSIQFSPFCHMARFPARLMTPLPSLSMCVWLFSYLGSSHCLFLFFSFSVALSKTFCTTDRPSGSLFSVYTGFTCCLYSKAITCVYTPQGQPGGWKLWYYMLWFGDASFSASAESMRNPSFNFCHVWSMVI